MFVSKVYKYTFVLILIHCSSIIVYKQFTYIFIEIFC
nr:MAG TPA: hypothetical protein [Caudoviricetes sp.]